MFARDVDECILVYLRMIFSECFGVLKEFEMRGYGFELHKLESR